MIIPAALQRYLRPLALEAARRGIAVFAVGGCVRDWILKNPTKDLDFVAESDPHPLAQFCRAKWRARVDVFDRFGTIRAITRDGFRMDFVRARAESYPGPAVLPVVRPGSLTEDLARRDFTINAMAQKLEPRGEGRLIDPHRGFDDLRRRVLRVLHERSFIDDPTRLFRAARFACRMGLKLDAKTGALRRGAVSNGAPKLLSRERIRTELVRILEEKDPVCALEKLKSWKLDAVVFPKMGWPKEIAAAEGAWHRLGLMALHMNSSSGKEFIRSLNLDREISQSIFEALEVEKEAGSPRSPLPPLAKKLLEIYLPELSRSALEPLMINGKDLQNCGLKAGPEFKSLLQRAAKAQWAGEFSHRSQALRWLRERLA